MTAHWSSQYSHGRTILWLLRSALFIPTTVFLSACMRPRYCTFRRSKVRSAQNARLSSRAFALGRGARGLSRCRWCIRSLFTAHLIVSVCSVIMLNLNVQRAMTPPDFSGNSFVRDAVVGLAMSLREGGRLRTGRTETGLIEHVGWNRQSTGRHRKRGSGPLWTISANQPTTIAHAAPDTLKSQGTGSPAASAQSVTASMQTPNATASYPHSVYSAPQIRPM